MLKRLVCVCLVFTFALCGSLVAQVATESQKPAAQKEGGEKIKVLIVDGQNNHDAWPKTTMMMKSYLEGSGKFTVDVYRTKFTWKGEKHHADFPLNDGKTYEVVKKAQPDPDFKPEFSNYHVVISNFGHGASDWPEETRNAFVKFVHGGGGFVSVHAADNSFPKWKEYNEMIGLGGWGGRNENNGPYVYYNDKGEVVRDDSKGGGGGHGPQHEFSLVVRNPDHPITNGLPKEFLHTKDELYERLRGPALNMNVLATAYAAPKYKGSGRHEPTLMTIDFGDGRVFHSTLGHADYSFECSGFQTVLLRGTEWAATGKVTIEVPDDFPTADSAVKREFKPAAETADK